MSDRNRRAKINLDYNILHNTGQKVVKVIKDGKMDVTEKQVREMQVCEDLTESFVLYALEDLETVSEISEGMNEISILAKLYRHVHVELKSVMKTEEYVETYKGYMEKTEKYRTFLRNGRAKVKLLAKAEKEMNEEKVANERRMEEEKVLGAKEREEQKVRKGIEIEEQIFQEKLEKQ